MGFLFFQAEDGIRDLVRSRGLGDVYKRQGQDDPDRLLAYREHLGMNNGALIDLDRRSSDEVLSLIHI